MEKALGLVETKGLIGAIEAADAMAKAADVKIFSREKTDPAMITIKCVGEVAAVKAAVEAGAAAAQRVGQLISVLVIPRPDEQLDDILVAKAPKNIVTFNIKDNTENSPQIKKNDSNKSVTKSTSKQNLVKNADRKSKVTNNTITEIDVENLDFSSLNKDKLEVMNINLLRKILRKLDSEISSKQISNYNKAKLISLILEKIPK
ncbi:MAG TPA: BMC domain-containing protein [Ignavibacteriales bacterium]|nr:BMC domain-containing protein [Ignavibacteriales bacterium]HOL82202.1 BMC domain-containing protein [Ignavibacteriales bacterium]HPD68004.1 BMC domain-containing protein [Ignavibacteriales bacterium]HPP34581.1 BMC domain-containing protein [Ignavibacteriales bacterium]HRR18027.1 BMC domain-containing protein [Ignavibacteriales bacterium]